ncbi:MAG: hypothetical protein AAGF93_14560 [Cyanobacteria bacterium P01_H01_bin.105]
MSERSAGLKVRLFTQDQGLSVDLDVWVWDHTFSDPAVKLTGAIAGSTKMRKGQR